MRDTVTSDPYSGVLVLPVEKANKFNEFREVPRCRQLVRNERTTETKQKMTLSSYRELSCACATVSRASLFWHFTHSRCRTLFRTDIYHIGLNTNPEESRVVNHRGAPFPGGGGGGARLPRPTSLSEADRTNIYFDVSRFVFYTSSLYFITKICMHV